MISVRADGASRVKRLMSSVATAMLGKWSLGKVPALVKNCEGWKPAARHEEVMSCCATKAECAKPMGQVKLTGDNQSRAQGVPSPTSRQYKAISSKL